MGKKEVDKILKEIMHPEIDASLMELGMIKDVKLKKKKVALTLLIPFWGVPIEGILLDSIRKALAKNGLEAEIKEDVMGSSERQKFLKISQEKWKG